MQMKLETLSPRTRIRRPVSNDCGKTGVTNLRTQNLVCLEIYCMKDKDKKESAPLGMFAALDRPWRPLIALQEQ